MADGYEFWATLAIMALASWVVVFAVFRAER